MNQVDPIRDINEIKAMYKVLSCKSKRDYLFFKFAIHTGVKLSELLNLCVSDVKVKKIKLNIIGLKNMHRIFILDCQIN